VTLSIWRMSSTTGEARTTFVDEFVEAVPSASFPTEAGAVATPDYIALVLGTAVGRPSELLLAGTRGRPIGRALVATSYAQPGTAVVGLFEVEPGPFAAEAGERLLAAASDWAARTGHRQLFGPVDLTTWYGYRLMVPPQGRGARVRRFDWEPPLREPYLDLFRRGGFVVADWYRTVGVALDAAGSFATGGPASYTAPAHAAAVAAGYAFVRLDGVDRFASLRDDLHALCTDAFRDNLLFEPLPLDRFRSLATGAASAHDSTLTHVVRAPDGRLAGVVFAFIDGAAVVFKTIAVAPGARGQHLSTALMHLVFERGAERGYRTFVFALVRSGNRSEFLIAPHLRPGLHSWAHDYVLLSRTIR
jgi:ribosomal protein S18 acetylase RimI-like enzyme